MNPPTTQAPPQPTKPKTKNPPATKKKRLFPTPYSSYTIYFRLERLRILQTQCGAPPPPTYDPSHYDAVEHPRPSSYRDVKLPPYWYSSRHRAAEEKKRKHRKDETGTLSKEALTSLIAASWKMIDEETLEYCKKLSLWEKRQRVVLEAEMAREESQASSGEGKEGAATAPGPPLWQNLKLPESLQSNCHSNTKKRKVQSENSGTTTKRAPLKKRPVPSSSSETSPSSSTTVPHSVNVNQLPPWALVQMAQSTSWPSSLVVPPAASVLNTVSNRTNLLPITETVRNISTDSIPPVRTEDDCLAAEVLSLIRKGEGGGKKEG